MAGKPKTFSDYYAESGGGTGKKSFTPSSVPSPSAPAEFKPIPFGSTDKNDSPQDPLSFLTDMLSRPLFSVTNRFSKALDAAADAPEVMEKLGRGDVAGGLGQWAGDLGETLAAPFTGFFSNDEDDKPYTSELIEKGTDVIGPMVDSKYTDQTDNVNPVVKGILGFVGDVGLDPLTYIPGSVIVSGAKAVVRGGKAVTAGVRAGVDATVEAARNAPKVDSAVEAVAKDATKIKAPTKASAEQAAIDKAQKAADDSFTAEYMAGLDKMDNATFEAFTAKRMESVAKADIARQAAKPKGAALKSALDGLTPMTLKTTVRAVTDPMAAKPLTFGVNQELASGVPGQGGWLAEASKAVEGFEKLSESPHITLTMRSGKQNRVPLSKVLLQAERGDKDALKLLRVYYERNYLPSFQHAKSQGKLIDAIGREIKPKKIKPEVMETVLTSLGNFKRQAAENEARLISQLGRPLYNALKSRTDPAGFDKVLSEMRGILDQSLDYSTLTQLSSPTERMLRQLGVDPGALPLNISKWQAKPNTAPPAKSIAEVVARMGDDASVDPEIVKLAEHAIRRAIEVGIVEPKIPGRYPFKSKTGALRTDELYGDGWGRYMREANTYFQWNVIKDMFKPARELAKAQGVTYARASAEAVKMNVKQSLRLAERWFDNNGVPMTVGVGPDRVPLAMSQVLDVLDEFDPKGMHAYFWNYSTSVPPTNLLDAVFAAVRGGDREQIEAMLRQTQTRHLSSDGRVNPLPNNMVKPIQNKLGGVLGREKFTADQLVAGLTNLIEKVTPALRHVVENNAIALKSRQMAEAYEMSDKQLAHLEGVFENRQGYGDILEELADTSTRVQKLAAEKGATQTATDVAGLTAEAMIPKLDMIVSKGATKKARVAAATEKASKAKTATALMDDIQRASIDDEQQLFDDVADAMADETLDLGQKINQMMGSGFVSKFVPVFSRMAGNEALHRDLVRSENWLRDVIANTTDKLNVLSSKFTQDQLRLAFQSVQRGIVPPDPAVAQAAEALSDITGQIFGGGSRNALLDNAFFRTNGSIHHVNKVIEFYFKNGDFLFDADKAAQEATIQGTTIMEQAANQWRNWDVQDPADFLNRMFTGVAKVNADQSIAQSFMNLAKNMNLVSKVPKAGYVRFTNEGGASVLARYLPTDRYYEAGIARQLGVVDTLMRDTLDFNGTFGKLVKEVYKPALDMWKYGMTLPNPTHHVRNLISDMSLTYLALGVKNSKDMYSKAMRAMMTRNGYDNWDAIAALQGAKVRPGATHDVALAGRHGELTYDQLYAEFASRGNLPRFRTLENFEQEAGQGALTSIWQGVTHTKAAQVIGGVSEARDHYVRLAHGIQFIEQNINSSKFKDMEALLTAASDSVRKWHPDGSDLTKSEQAFRLVIPFYSWQRKAIPLIVQSLLTTPARVMTFPKASFNLAVAMGVNPDSLADPFPQDQMFPSYMTNKLNGPQFEIDGKYYGINPGFAPVDILNEYLGDEAYRSVLGSVSPFIRAPFEMAAGGQVGTGARINDYSDYVDSQIPGVSHLSRLSGSSVTGSLLSMLQGKGLDPQFQIAAGNKDPVGGPALSAVNWLTGIGLTPYSQPNQINYAEIEKRNREGDTGGF